MQRLDFLQNRLDYPHIAIILNRKSAGASRKPVDFKIPVLAG
jgi:hypothetical protein